MRVKVNPETNRPQADKILSADRINSSYPVFRKGILFICLTLCSCYLFSQEYSFRNFNSNDGLAQPYVYSIVQDKAGCLWIGTGNGLTRYNGIEFKTFTTTDSLADNFVTSGITDGQSLWFGHMNGSLSHYDGKHFTAYRAVLPGSGPVTHFAKSPDGRIWLSSYTNGIIKMDDVKNRIKQSATTDQVLISTFEFLNDRELLAGTNEGLFLYGLDKSDKLERIKVIEEIPQSKITCICKSGNERGYYIATENEGIFQLRMENGLLQVSGVLSDQSFEITGIQDIIVDTHSDLWIGTIWKGLIKARLSKSGKMLKISSLNVTTGFSTDNVKTVFQDREGTIWSGNYGRGLTQIIPRAFSLKNIDVARFGDIHSVCPANQYLYIGTEKTLVRMDTLTGIVTGVSKGNKGLPADIINALYWDGLKDLWIATEKNGLFRIDPETGKIVKYPMGDDALENSITSIAGKGEMVYAGTKKGLCAINVVSGKVKWYSINLGGLPHNFIKSLYIDSRNRLWVTTHSNTLSSIEDEKVSKIPINSGSVLSLGQITEDSDSRIWVGSEGNGIFLIGADTIANLTTKEGLLSNFCYSILSDDRKNIWIGHKGGLSRVRTSDFSVRPFQDIEGIAGNYQFNSSVMAGNPDGKIWFASDKAVILYYPLRDIPSSAPPVLSINSLRINDELKEYQARIVLSPGFYKIRIDYLAVSLREPALVSYQYRLDGYDQWSDVTRNTSVTYTHLGGGDYTFILKASDADGVVTEKPLVMRLIIKQPVWKKWWFYLMDFSLVLLFSVLYIKRREQKFIMERRILEEKVQERTTEIQKQKSEIELQRDIIGEKNRNIMASIKYASNIQNAVLTPRELIDKLLPDNFILSLPKDIVSGDFYWLAEKNGKIVFVVADCTGHGVPGAFMSLLGITLLNDIVNIQGITQSDLIVSKLREGVINSLEQGRKEITSSDGMDISLCVLDRRENKIQFTGGINDIVYIRDGKMEIVKADKLSVCRELKSSEPFTKQEIEYRKGDLFYLFTDGYQDQFGGEYDKKFLRQHFFVTLLEIYKLPMPRQKEILEKKLRDWIGTNDQTDDVTVIGIRF